MHIVILYQLKIPHKQAHIIRPLIIIFQPCTLSPMNWKISASSRIHIIYRKIHTPKPLFGRKKRQNYRNINVFKTHSFTPSTLICLKSQADFNMINKKPLFESRFIFLAEEETELESQVFAKVCYKHATSGANQPLTFNYPSVFKIPISTLKFLFPLSLTFQSYPIGFFRTLWHISHSPSFVPIPRYLS